MKKINRATNEVNKLLEKRRMMFNVIALARNDEIPDEHIIREETEMEKSFNTCQIFDE